MTNSNSNSLNATPITKNSEYFNATTQLIADFQSNPQKYFAEAELQYELYCILKSSKTINKYVQTNDGLTVTTVHPEYPSVNRVQLKNGKGYRAWFDIAVLSPDFIKSSSYKAVWARNEFDAKLEPENILAAFEFKFFPVKRTYDVSSVEQDCLKLSLCGEIKERHVLAFSSYEIEAPVVQRINVRAATLFWATPRALHFRSTNGR